MNKITRTKFRAGTLILPPAMRKAWSNREVILVPQTGRLIIQPLEAEWDRYEANMAKAKNKISPATIAAAVRWAKRR